MWRMLNISAVAALIGSALYSYSIKYDTIWYAEQIVKLKNQIQREHNDISGLRAEWAHLTRPERIDALAAKNLGLQPMSLGKIARAQDLPDRGPKVDAIGRKLDALGLGEETSTPRAASAGLTTPPAAKPQ